MIKTSEIQHTPKILFHLWLKRSVRPLILTALIIFIILNILDVFVGAFIQLSRSNLPYFELLIPTFWSYLQFWWVLLPINIFGILLMLGIRTLSVWFLYSSKKNQIFYKPFYYEMDDQFIKVIKNDGAESAFTWDSIVKVEKVDAYYILMVGSINALYVPLQAFSKTVDQEEFLKLLEKVLPPAKKAQ